jgi:hypothetical protein
MEYTENQLAEIKSSPMLLNFHLGATEGWEIYKKVSKGRVTYHRYRDDHIVNPKLFPESFRPLIGAWNNEIDAAKHHRDTVEQERKLTEDRAALVEHIAALEVEVQTPPENYATNLARWDDIRVQPFYYTVSVAGVPRYFSKEGKVVRKSKIPAADIPHMLLRTEAMTHALEFEVKMTKKLPAAREKLAALDARLAFLALQPRVENYTEILQQYETTKAAVRKRMTDRPAVVWQEVAANVRKRRAPEPVIEEIEAEGASDFQTRVVDKISPLKRLLTERHADKNDSDEQT